MQDKLNKRTAKALRKLANMLDAGDAVCVSGSVTDTRNPLDPSRYRGPYLRHQARVEGLSFKRLTADVSWMSAPK